MPARLLLLTMYVSVAASSISSVTGAEPSGLYPAAGPRIGAAAAKSFAAEWAKFEGRSWNLELPGEGAFTILSE